MSQERRREMVDREHPVLSTVRQCALLDISRFSLYYRHKGNASEDLVVMKAIDQQYLATPFYGSRRMRVWLQRQGCRASRKRVQRLIRTMGLVAIYRRPRTSKPAPGHKVYSNQVWAADITYIPMARGHIRPWATALQPRCSTKTRRHQMNNRRRGRYKGTEWVRP